MRYADFCPTLKPFRLLLRPAGLALLFVLGSAFFPHPHPAPPCYPQAHAFYGYSFLYPEIINKNAAYAPFFLRWDDYYQRFYYNRDVQREENIEEWIGRFCDQPLPADVEYVVYKADFNELTRLRTAALDKEHRTVLPYTLGGNTFAEMIALNGCTEVIDYLMFAKKCEPYVIQNQDGWVLSEKEPEVMQVLIREGLGRFKNTASHFLRLRYAYQIVRLAHYAGKWQQTVDLYNDLMPQIDRKKNSIIYYWMMGHLAGALQKLGKYPEAAYRYSLVFRYCASKRTQAYRSFIIRNDQDWDKTLKLCQDDQERATLYLLRAGGTHTYAVEDLQTIYKLDPKHPQLDLLLVSDIQELEKLFLRTPVTDKKFGAAESAIKQQHAADHLLRLQTFVRQCIKDNEIANPKLWRCLRGYLELLAGDRYAAEKSLERIESDLDDEDPYDQKLLQQIAIWRLVLEIQQIDPKTRYADEAAFRIRSYETFQLNPNFESYLKDWLSEAYALSNRPGKAFLTAYDTKTLKYNPRLDVLDDLIKTTETEDPRMVEKIMDMDTTPDRIRARLLEIKGVYFYGIGQHEAALAAFRAIPRDAKRDMRRFSPFREVFHERINAPITDTLLLTREQILQKLADYEFQAKAAQASDDPAASWYYYLCGLGYYNMSYFGYEWEAMDFFRSGQNWLRLQQGPVFPLYGAPDGNRENIDVSIALSYFERALTSTRSREMAARAAFMAARCQQKQWFCSDECRYKPGSKLIPLLPKQYNTYYELLIEKYSDTEFFAERIKECSWFAAYARRQ